MISLPNPPLITSIPDNLALFDKLLVTGSSKNKTSLPSVRFNVSLPIPPSNESNDCNLPAIETLSPE